MRFIDRLYMDRPELVENRNGRLIVKSYVEAGCPYQCGYETEDEGRDACFSIVCAGCWDREMPESSLPPQIDLPDDFFQEILEVCEI